MGNNFRIRTPQNWVQFLRGLELHKSAFDSWEVNASHLIHPTLQGIYTEFQELKPIPRRDGESIRYSVEVKARDKSASLSSLVPSITPNPIYINFRFLSQKDLPEAINFLERIYEAGYSPASEDSSIYFSVGVSKYLGAGITLGRKVTHLSNLETGWLQDEKINKIIRKETFV